ncbi:unnamed protein product [Penicillium manginii]
MTKMQSINNLIQQIKETRLVESHNDLTPNVSTIHAENSTNPTGERSFATKAADSDEPKNAQAATQETSNQIRQERFVEIDRSVAAEIVNRPKMPQYPDLDRWILVEKLGHGAFSNVYRARDSTTEFGEVAIKVLRSFQMDSNQRANILNEVQIMRNIDHPNIVKLIDFFESHQFCYIILELCTGGELLPQIVRLSYFSEDLSKHVIVQVAKAIEYLHETSGVVHRDIKPENILFVSVPFTPSKNPKPQQPGDEDKEDEGEFTSKFGSGGIGEIKIADFGLSKVIWDNRTGTPCGTVGYTAPEIVNDEQYSMGVDMWAMGCVLYTLLCGFPPFYDESIQVLTKKIACGQFIFLSPWWDHISKSAQDLVSHLLIVDPKKRYNIKEFMEHPWIRQADEETVFTVGMPPLDSLTGPALWTDESNLPATAQRRC